MKQLLVLFITLAPLFSHAVKWVERGNGGFVLKCKDSENQVFDIYEARKRFQVLDQKNLSSVDERVQYLLGKIEKVNPSRAALYRGWYASFMGESEFLDGVELTPVPDIGLGIKPKNCDLELAVFQREPDALNKKRYVISLDLWNSLDNLNKAALIIHEITYRELIEVGSMHQTSESTRYFNSALHSEKFEYLTIQEYLSLLQNLRFPRADYNGYTIRLMYTLENINWRISNIEFHANGALKMALLANDGLMETGNTRYIQCLPWDSTIHFNEDGTVAQIRTLGTYKPDCDTAYIYQEGATKIRFEAEQWTFDKNGQVNKVSGSLDFRDTPTAIVINGILLTRDNQAHYSDRYDVSVKLNSDGKLHAFEIQQVSSPCFRKESSRIEFKIGVNTPPLNLSSQKFAEDLAKLPLCKK